jgi:hypothetical protein
VAEDSPDAELGALQVILNALRDLEPEAQFRVLDYVFKRLGVSAPPLLSVIGDQPFEPLRETRVEDMPRDVRSLKEAKRPRTSIEMAAIVAYYLSELAPEGERKDAIGQADIQAYFKQARYPLPSAVRMTLPRAAAAGYFNQVGRGLFRLNAVGHNLVVHNLPPDSTETATTRGPQKRRSSGTKS